MGKKKAKSKAEAGFANVAPVSEWDDWDVGDERLGLKDITVRAFKGTKVATAGAALEHLSTPALADRLNSEAVEAGLKAFREFFAANPDAKDPTKDHQGNGRLGDAEREHYAAIRKLARKAKRLYDDWKQKSAASLAAKKLYDECDAELLKICAGKPDRQGKLFPTATPALEEVAKAGVDDAKDADAKDPAPAPSWRDAPVADAKLTASQVSKLGDDRSTMGVLVDLLIESKNPVDWLLNEKITQGKSSAQSIVHRIGIWLGKRGLRLTPKGVVDAR